MKQKTLLLIVFISLISFGIQAQSRDAVKKSTDILMYVPQVAGLITTLILEDFKGTKQLVFAGETSLATTYVLKRIVKKQRPDRSNNLSFPSGHTATAFQGASFIARRYGWK